ncbi:hypothetical protein [Azospirillum sp. TSO5]|uniref:hypothetical protein n=1 Tax=Azospirillum sp. TSO5 TaxID=716760 RepID=UPI000D648E89|nr:hypothetical protein [Azospirillum sp. TSO5]
MSELIKLGARNFIRNAGKDPRYYLGPSKKEPGRSLYRILVQITPATKVQVFCYVSDADGALITTLDDSMSEVQAWWQQDRAYRKLPYKQKVAMRISAGLMRNKFNAIDTGILLSTLFGTTTDAEFASFKSVHFPDYDQVEYMVMVGWRLLEFGNKVYHRMPGDLEIVDAICRLPVDFVRRKALEGAIRREMSLADVKGLMEEWLAHDSPQDSVTLLSDSGGNIKGVL